VHSAGELARAAAAGATLIGINNRDLRTFATRLQTTLELRPQVPRQATVVSESGIRCRRDVLRLEAAGVDAVLVGEALMRQTDIGAKVRELLGTQAERQERP
jgi:indole-3-glycerol phosphate synthase